MDNFEEKFLEELAKAQARLEGKEPYDDAAIEKEFDPNAETVKTESAPKKAAKPQTPKEEKPVKKDESTITAAKQETPTVKVQEKRTEKKKVSTEKLAVIGGGAAVAISFVLSCLGLLVESTSSVWQIFKAYMPFIGIVCGAAAVISGALLIKNNKKGTLPLVLGLLSIFIAVFISSISF